MENGLRWAAIGCGGVGFAFLYMAIPIGIEGPYAPWGLTFYAAAAGMGIAALGLMASTSIWGLRTASLGFGVGSLAGANLLRMWLANFTGPDAGVIVLLAWLATPTLGLGLLGASWPLLGAWKPPPPRNPRIALRAWAVLPGAVAGAFWLVHDISKGIERQLLPDLLFLAGFVVVWFGLRKGHTTLDRSTNPPAVS